jgi:hypothetical protein
MRLMRMRCVGEWWTVSRTYARWLLTLVMEGGCVAWDAGRCCPWWYAGGSVIWESGSRVGLIYCGECKRGLVRLREPGDDSAGRFALGVGSSWHGGVDGLTYAEGGSTEKGVASDDGVVSRAKDGMNLEVATGGGMSCVEEMVDDVGGSESVVVTEGIALCASGVGDVGAGGVEDAIEAGEVLRDGVDAAERCCAAGEGGELSTRAARLVASAKRVTCWATLCAAASWAVLTPSMSSSSCSLAAVSATLPGVGGGERAVPCEGAQPSVLSLVSLMSNHHRLMAAPSLERNSRISLYAGPSGRVVRTCVRSGRMTGAVW